MSLKSVSCKALDKAADQSGQTKLGLAAGVAISILMLALSYKYLRFIFPCITPTELEPVLQRVENQYRQAIVQDVYGAEWDEIPNRLFRLKIEASTVRQKSFRVSRWNTYLGLHPGLIPEIVQWYKKSEALRFRISTALENSLRDRLESENHRRELCTRRPTVSHGDYLASSSALELPSVWSHSSAAEHGGFTEASTEVTVIHAVPHIPPSPTSTSTRSARRFHYITS